MMGAAWRWSAARACLVAAIVVGGCDRVPTGPGATIAVSNLSLAPETVTAGMPSEATVTLSRRAPRNGTEVALASSDVAAVVPSSVLVAAEATTATFTMRTQVVAADTIATIGATVAGAKREATLRVMTTVPRAPTLQALEVDQAVVRGGQRIQATVRLTGPAMTMVSVLVRSSHPAATVPGVVAIAAGMPSSTFSVTTHPVDLETQLEITATFGDQIRTVSIRVTP